MGALVRLAVLVEKWDRGLLLNDSMYYSGQAIQLADGTFFRELFVDQPGAEHGPLTAILLAPVSWVDDPTPWQRLLTTLFGLATVVVLGLVGHALGGRRVAVVAAWVAALYPNLWMNDALVMSESLSLLLVSSVLLVGLRLLRTATPRLAILAGALCGLGALSRSELVLLAPALAIAVWLVHRGWRHALMVVGACLAVLAPWITFNVTRFEHLVTLTTNDGTTLLGSYCDETFFGPSKGGWSLSCVVNDPQYRLDEEPSVRSARQRSLARAYAADHLSDLPGVVAARLGRTLDLYAVGDLLHQDVGEERYRWAAWAGVVSWWTFAPLAVLGVGRLARRERLLLAIPVAIVLVVTIAFYGGHRIRSSMEPSVVAAVAVAVVWLADRTRRAAPT